MHTEPQIDGLALHCPYCKQETISLKSLKMFDWLLFLGLAASIRSTTVVGCPPCVRRRLVRRGLACLLPAHVIWPLTVLPLHLVQWLRTFGTGHSSAIRERLPHLSRGR